MKIKKEVSIIDTNDNCIVCVYIYVCVCVCVYSKEYSVFLSQQKKMYLHKNEENNSIEFQMFFIKIVWVKCWDLKNFSCGKEVGCFMVVFV